MKAKRPKRIGEGRPTSYSKEILDKAIYYRDNWKEIDPINLIPTIECLSLYLRINKDTIYEWIRQEDKKEFSDIYRDIMSRQGNYLINGGLGGTFAPTITKVMLTKHGYREGIDQTTNDKSINQDQETKDKIDALVKEFICQKKKD